MLDERKKTQMMISDLKRNNETYKFFFRNIDIKIVKFVDY